MQEFGDVLYSWTAAIPLITTGISALTGLFNKNKQQQQQTSNFNNITNQSGTQNYSNTTTPNYDPYMSKVKDYIMGTLLNKQRQSTDMSPYLSSGIKSINTNAVLKNALLKSNLAARGLSSSPMGAWAEAGLDSQRNADIVNYENQMPILQRQFQNEDMESLSRFFQSLPVGNTTSGTSTSQSTSNQQGTSTGTGTAQGSGGIGDMFSGLGSGLAATYGLNYWLQQLAKQRQVNPNSSNLNANDLLNILPGISGS